MKKRQKLFIGVLALLIIGCWAILAFCIREDLVSRFSLWSSMIVGTAATMISFIALYISYLSFKNENGKDKATIDIETKKTDNSNK